MSICGHGPQSLAFYFDCCWVGSLDFNFLGNNPPKKVNFLQGDQQQPSYVWVLWATDPSEEWDAAVRKVELQRGACSLACVFLTDETSGLGGHEQNPEHPGDCWCRALYGRVNAAAYISIVEDPSSMTEDELRFKEMDAKAMGQEFLRRGSQSDAEWERDKENAEAKAQEKCDKNRGLAPWGCCWFHSWKKNVDDAVALGQTLHVFYFEGKLGRGKLQWNELSRETSVAQARKDSGLGASQTAEVAYLQKCGYQFAEHDVVDFYNFMAAHRDEE